ncbi:alpha-ketoglutarate decarboxylase [Tamlana sp. I1]|uniref:alpha-ketoglutarate decarboxylase n=1 Tax=Tamlana sp. I1 TaxID=2762061 RepID=UPI001E36A4EE|nr:alpha-ketoglutarate decarboxylase [Tamlana sp. I1]
MTNTLFLINKKACLVFALFFFCILKIEAQQPTNDFWNHVRFGGSLGLSFGDNFFSGTIAPSGIYQFNNKFALGLGLNATFNNQKDVYKSTILGGSVIGLYNIIEAIQVSAEFEQLHVDRNYRNSAYYDDKYWLSSLYLGAGYRTGNITFGIRYDVLYNNGKSIYTNPWSPFFRVYF